MRGQLKHCNKQLYHGQCRPLERPGTSGPGGSPRCRECPCKYPCKFPREHPVCCGYLRLPRGQYSVTTQVRPGSTQAPTNELMLSCLMFTQGISDTLADGESIETSRILVFVNKIFYIFQIYLRSLSAFNSIFIFRVMSTYLLRKLLTEKILPL